MVVTIELQPFLLQFFKKSVIIDTIYIIGVYMNKIILALVVVIFSSCLSANAAGYCPSSQEVHNKSVSWMTRSTGASLDQLNALIKEQDSYMNNLLPNCLNYFKSTPNANCDRLSTVSAAYMMTPKDKQNLAKLQILTATAPHKARCQYQFQALQLMLK